MPVVKKPVKKKKKEPPFIIPEWAKDMKILVDKTNEMKGLILIKDDLGFDDTFIIKCKEQLARLDNEIKFRKNEYDLQKKLEEEKKNKKKKK